MAIVTNQAGSTTELTKSILEYQVDGSWRKNIIDSVYIIIYNFPIRKRYLSEEEASGFLLFIIPKVEPILNRFTYKGVSFETYLHKILYWQIKTYRKQEKDHRMKEVVYTSFFLNSMDYVTHTDTYFPDVVMESGSDMKYGNTAVSDMHSDVKLSNSDRQKLFILTLKYAHMLSSKAIAKAAVYIQIPEDQLHTHILQLKCTLDDHYERVEALQVRLSHHFFSLIESYWYGKGIARTVQNKEDLSAKIKRYNRILAVSRKNMEQICGSIQYKAIADLLQIPVGTVASKLHYSRKMLDRLTAGADTHT